MDFTSSAPQRLATSAHMWGSGNHGRGSGPVSGRWLDDGAIAVTLRARTVALIVVGVGFVFVALMVGAAAAITWVIAPREYSVDSAVEQQVMNDLEPWSDQVMAVQAPVTIWFVWN
jgi:hypothetical protein